MSGRLRASDSTHHNLSMINGLRCEAMREKRAQINTMESHSLQESRSRVLLARRTLTTQTRAKQWWDWPRRRGGRGFCAQCKFGGRRRATSWKNRLSKLTKAIKKSGGNSTVAGLNHSCGGNSQTTPSNLLGKVRKSFL
jgi:hypothetical protein